MARKNRKNQQDQDQALNQFQPEQQANAAEQTAPVEETTQAADANAVEIGDQNTADVDSSISEPADNDGNQ